MRNLGYQCIHEKEVLGEKITRPGSAGYVNIRKVFDPEANLTHRAILAIHEHPAHMDPIVPHYHRKVEETVYLISGKGEVRLGFSPEKMEKFSIKEGTAWYIPPNCWHQIINQGNTVLKMVVNYFSESKEPVSHTKVSKELTETI